MKKLSEKGSLLITVFYMIAILAVMMLALTGVVMRNYTRAQKELAAEQSFYVTDSTTTVTSGLLNQEFTKLMRDSMVYGVDKGYKRYEEQAASEEGAKSLIYYVNDEAQSYLNDNIDDIQNSFIYKLEEQLAGVEADAELEHSNIKDISISITNDNLFFSPNSLKPYTANLEYVVRLNDKDTDLSVTYQWANLSEQLKSNCTDVCEGRSGDIHIGVTYVMH